MNQVGRALRVLKVGFERVDPAGVKLAIRGDKCVELLVLDDSSGTPEFGQASTDEIDSCSWGVDFDANPLFIHGD